MASVRSTCLPEFPFRRCRGSGGRSRRPRCGGVFRLPFRLCGEWHEGGMQQKRALVTGITGQDGAYLAELLLAKGYEVHGLKRRASSFNSERIDHLHHELDDTRPGVHLHYGDLTDSLSLLRVIQQVKPDEIYNLAAQSHVAVSFEEPEYTANADGIGTLRVLEAMRSLGLGDRCRFYQASTSELYGL